GQLDAAEACYRQAMEARPRAPEPRLQLALLLEKRSAFAEAVDLLEGLRDRGYRKAQVLWALARIARQRGDAQTAKTWLDELLAEFPNDPGALTERSRYLLEEGNPTKAEAMLRRAAEENPQDRQ